MATAKMTFQKWHAVRMGFGFIQYRIRYKTRSCEGPIEVRIRHDGIYIAFDRHGLDTKQVAAGAFRYLGEVFVTHEAIISRFRSVRSFTVDSRRIVRIDVVDEGVIYAPPARPRRVAYRMLFDSATRPALDS